MKDTEALNGLIYADGLLLREVARQAGRTDAFAAAVRLERLAETLVAALDDMRRTQERIEAGIVEASRRAAKEVEEHERARQQARRIGGAA